MNDKKVSNKGSSSDPSVEELMASASDNKALMHMITGVSGAGVAALLVGGVLFATNVNDNDSQVASDVRVTHESTENDSDSETSASTEETKTQQTTESDDSNTDDNTVTDQNEIPGIGGGSGHNGNGEPSEQGNVGGGNGQQTKGTYVIKDGDTLSSISGSLGISIDRLIGYNEIVNPNVIYAGAALELPIR